MFLISRLAVKFLLVVCSCMLVACSEERATNVLDDYLDRLSNVVNVDREPDIHFYRTYLSSRSTFTFPSNLEQEDFSQSAQTIGLLDFLSLYGCDLQTLVAERNSSLGKLARPSQYMLYELSFLHLSPKCVEELKSEGKLELVEQLSEVTHSKKERLSKLIWQTILTGDEAGAFWKMEHDIGDYPNKEVVDVILALNTLRSFGASWMQGVYETGLEELESHLAVLAYPDGGALLKSFLLYKHALEEANNLLDQAVLCRNESPQFNTTAAQNVVTKFFAGKVQIWASQLSQRYYEMMPVYRDLEHLFKEVESVEYEKWRQERDRFFDVAIKASQSHVRRLEILINGCAAPSE